METKFVATDFNLIKQKPLCNKRGFIIAALNKPAFLILK